MAQKNFSRYNSKQLQFMRIASAVLLLFALCTICRADEIPAPVLNLARINHRISDELKRLPQLHLRGDNRPLHGLARGKRKPFDRIRINVAIVDGKELYSWPGAKSFEDRTLGEMVNNGFISDGDFSVMTHNVFVHRNAAITFVRQEMLEGRPVLRYNFEVSQMQSGWSVRLRGASGIVGAKGWFLADAATYDLVRFSFAAVDLPPFSPDKRIEEDIAYGRVRLGSADILLPITVDVESEATMAMSIGTTPRSTAAASMPRSRRFPSVTRRRLFPLRICCRSSRQNRAPALRPRNSVATGNRTRFIRTAVGDEIHAVVSKDVRIQSEVILPRGALVKGVIRRFDRQVGNRLYFAVGIEFTEAVYEGQRAALFGKMDDIPKFNGLHRNVIGFDVAADSPPIPGVSYFYVEGESFVLSKGLSLVWLTVAFPNEMKAGPGLCR